MSEHYHTIVPLGTNSIEASELARKVLQYLQKRNIVSTEKADCFLGNKEGGYLPGSNYAFAFKHAQDDLLERSINGFEILIGKQVFPSNWLDELLCPNCKMNILDTEWGDALSEWCANTGKDKINCTQCSDISSIVDYIFEPTWAFGELGFKFWNWGDEFNDSFIADIGHIINGKVKIVYGRL